MARLGGSANPWCGQWLLGALLQDRSSGGFACRPGVNSGTEDQAVTPTFSLHWGCSGLCPLAEASKGATSASLTGDVPK